MEKLGDQHRHSTCHGIAKDGKTREEDRSALSQRVSQNSTRIIRFRKRNSASEHKRIDVTQSLAFHVGHYGILFLCQGRRAVRPLLGRPSGQGDVLMLRSEPPEQRGSIIGSEQTV